MTDYNNVKSAGELYYTVKRADEFEVTEQHLKLLGHTYVSWDSTEFGAPAIDAKRPYGDSDVLGDMAAILGLSFPPSDADDFHEQYDEFVDAWGDDLRLLHAETGLVLQIVLTAQSFEPGLYRRMAPYSNQWERVPTS
jgi:hypothetical protein